MSAKVKGDDLLRPRGDQKRGGGDNSQRDADFMRIRDEERKHGEEKTARLRALRLAKEASDREQAARDALSQPAKKPARKKPKQTKPEAPSDGER